MSSTLFLIDAFSIAYRAFYSYPPHLSLEDGTPANAIYGFVSLIFKSLDMFKPEYVCVCFDRKEPTFRHDLYKDYKGHRPPPPEEFVAQIPYFRQVLDELGISWVDSVGYEADDIIGTLSVQATTDAISTIIMTGDHDALQLVNESVSVIMNKKGVSEFIRYTPELVTDKYSFGPDKIVDFKALKGDASDNIPGVKGVGDKTATKLLLEYNDLEGIYSHLDSISSKSVQNKLSTSKEDAFLSRELAAINCEVPLDQPIHNFQFQPDWDVITNVFKNYQFNSLMSKYKSYAQNSETKLESTINSDEPSIQLPVEGMYQLIETVEDLNLLLPIMNHGFAIDLETTSLTPHSAQIVGIAVAMSERKAYYIPLNHFLKEDTGESSLPMFGSQTVAQVELPLNPILDWFKPLLEDPNILKITHNGKYELQIFKRYGIHGQGFDFDTLIAAYLLDPGSRLGLKELVKLHFDFEMQPFESLVSKNAPYQRFQDVPEKKALSYAAADADFTYRLMTLFKPKIDSTFKDIFTNLEMPLMAVLADMEFDGVSIDTVFLHELKCKFEIEKESIESDIVSEAGESFNINSPKQLSDILFNKMQMPVIKKNKSGPSTDSSVLEKLSKDFPFVAKVLDYRHYAKLLSTYVTALPELVHHSTQKVHAQFNQTVTATGRLSSSNPNLQNIPIRTKDGIQVRKGFVSSFKNGSIISADYSQVELRVLAHMADDPNMIASFKNGLDIHQSTAALVFDVDYDEVTKEQRYQAKTVNFGITYGQSAFALADQLQISRPEAKHIIDTYYLNFPTIRQFIDSTVQFAFQNGYVETAFGRRRYIPELNSSNKMLQNSAQRMAVNTRVQGTAADIIKMAMIDIQDRLKQDDFQSKMIIQVHDELVFDVKEDDLSKLEDLVLDSMESVVDFSVPLKVDLSVAQNWMDCELN